MIAILRATTDGSGAAVVTNATGIYKNLYGSINAISVDYAAGLAVGTTFTLVETTGAGLTRTILSRAATATDFVATPVQAGTLADGTAVTNSFVTYYLTGGVLTLTVSASTASITDALIVKLIIKDFNYS